jgi:drug/metabolite transporter (DMT)-like permease
MTFFDEKVQKQPSPVFCMLPRLPNLFGKINLAVLSAACYGLTIVATKEALVDLPPLPLLTIQTASSVTFFWLAILWQGVRIKWEWETLKVGMAGLLEPGLSYLFGMVGLSLTTASNASFIGTTETIVTIALSWLLLGEQISFLLIIFAILASMGVAIVSSPTTEIGQTSLWGDVLLLVSVLCSSLYTVATSRSMKSLSPLPLAAIQQSIALILFLAVNGGIALFNVEAVNLSGISWKAWLLALASGAFGYGLAFWLFLLALDRQSASNTSLYLTLMPIFGAVGAYFLLGERLLPLQGLGGILILVAVMGISLISRHTKTTGDRESLEIST